MKLHLGCGHFYKEGYINIDINPKVKADRYFDLNKPLDYPDESVEEILAIHLIEHLKPKTIGKVLKSWYRVLKKGGKLIIEAPDLEVCMEKFLKNKTPDILKWIFGNQDNEYQVHYWGYEPSVLAFYLERTIGFKKVRIKEPQDDTRPKKLCFRIEAVK